MQDYEYMYEVCLCSVLEDRSHMETLFTGFKLTGKKGGGVCRVWYDLTNDLEKSYAKKTWNHRKLNDKLKIGWQSSVLSKDQKQSN